VTKQDVRLAPQLLRDFVPKSPPGWSRFPLAASPTNWELTRFGVFVFQDISESSTL
jgi:hypothetical protein